jgi:hypothetical protein
MLSSHCYEGYMRLLGWLDSSRHYSCNAFFAELDHPFLFAF